MDRDTASRGLSDVQVFISHSHEDQELVQRLLRRLVPVARARLGIDVWTSDSITAGETWSDVLADRIAKASIFILCMSPDYLASEFCYNVELPAIKQRVRSSDGLIIPVIMSECAWWGFVDDFQVVPTHQGRVLPISNWRRQEDGLFQATAQVIEGIRHHYALPAGQSEPSELETEPSTPRIIQPAPPGPHHVSPRDIDRAVKTVIARRAAKHGV